MSCDSQSQVKSKIVAISQSVMPTWPKWSEQDLLTMYSTCLAYKEKQINGDIN